MPVRRQPGLLQCGCIASAGLGAIAAPAAGWPARRRDLRDLPARRPPGPSDAGASVRGGPRREPFDYGAPVSFDITSTVDLQEVDNAVNQARKEVAQRYDFKGSRAAIELNQTENTIVLTADDDFKMTALWEILQTRMVRRGVPTKNLTPGEVERAANDTVRAS